MKNPIAPFSPLHLVGLTLITASGAIVHTAAFFGSRRWTLAAMAVGTLGGLAVVYAPSMFEVPPPPAPPTQRSAKSNAAEACATEVAEAIRAGQHGRALEIVRALVEADQRSNGVS